MERTHYWFDRQPIFKIFQRPPNRLRFYKCQAPDCGLVIHYFPKKGERPIWCSDRCRARERQRRLKQMKAKNPCFKKKRHKGVFGTQHWGFR